MDSQTLKEMLRKKIVEMKQTDTGFYTETYNLVSVLVKLTPNVDDLITDKLPELSRNPKGKNVSLSQLERLYFRFKEDPNLKIRSKIKLDMDDIKDILDYTRRTLLFFLAFVEEERSDYGILREQTEGDD